MSMKHSQLFRGAAAAVAAFLLSLTAAMAQQKVTVSGVVYDDQGLPMIGAGVLEKGTVNGVITDLDGKFSISVPEGSTVEFSCIGYVPQEIVATSSTSVSITLKVDNLQIEESVVIGYGVQKKSNVTGAISSIKDTDLKGGTISNAASALQGKVSGVQVVNNSGAPGSTPTLRVRGYSSNGTSDPLYVVDGLKVSNIDYLDPSTIERMEVLKDAASAAIYGAEAGNGVILITTKSGKKGTSKITFDAQWTFSNLAHRVDLMDASQYKEFYTEAFGETFTNLYNSYYVAGTDTDWQKEMYETGKVQKYSLGLQGANENGNFFATLSYLDNNGMVIYDKDFYKRLSGQINASYNIRPWLQITTNNTISSVDNSTISENNVRFGIMKDVLLMDPLTPTFYTSSNIPTRVQNWIANGLHPAQDADGNYYGYSWARDSMNPLGEVGTLDAHNRIFYVNGSTALNISPIKNLVFTSRLGYSLYNVNQNSFVPVRVTGYFKDVDTDLSLQSTTTSVRYYQWENFANYTLETKGMGTFGLMAGMSYSNKEVVSVSGKTNALSSDAENFRYLNYSTNSADDYVYGNTAFARQIAYFGRLSWDYLGRYNAQFNFRADSYDSAYLDLDHNWGFFPSVSIGWIFSQEDFMKGVVGDVFSYGKLRASWGVNGSISNLGGYMYAAILNAGQYDTSTMTANMSYYMNGSLYTGVYPSKVLANPSLRWERSKQWDLGFDLRWFSGRLSTTIDYYSKLTDGLLVASVAPLSTGASTVYQNLGKVTNKGLELEIDWKDTVGDFSYGIKGNLSTVKNLVKEYAGEGVRITGSTLLGSSSALTYFEEGYPLWYIRGYKLTGVDQSTGAPIFEDVDGDGTITDADRTNLGSGIPKFSYGLTLTAAWKGFDAIVYTTGVSGNKLVYGMMSTDPSSVANRPMFSYDGRWTSASSSATMPSAMYQVNDQRIYNSDAYVFDASFFKIKQIQLGYTLPKNICQKVFMESIRAFVSLDNYFTFTKYPGSDPELNASGSAMAIDYGAYPMAKSVSFGVNVSF